MGSVRARRGWAVTLREGEQVQVRVGAALGSWGALQGEGEMENKREYFYLVVKALRGARAHTGGIFCPWGVKGRFRYLCLLAAELCPQHILRAEHREGRQPLDPAPHSLKVVPQEPWTASALNLVSPGGCR